MKIKDKLKIIFKILSDEFDEDDLNNKGIYITKSIPLKTIHRVFIRPINYEDNNPICDYCGEQMKGELNSYLCHYCGWHFCENCRLPERHNCKGNLKSPHGGGVERYGYVYGE